MLDFGADLKEQEKAFVAIIYIVFIVSVVVVLFLEKLFLLVPRRHKLCFLGG